MSLLLGMNKLVLAANVTAQKGTCLLTVKDYLETLYYIAFIVLTFLLVQYAIKSYKLESSRRIELLCKLVILETATIENFIGYGLEIYNAGNLVAKNVEVLVGEKFITNLDFVKPGDSSIYPLGTMLRTVDDVISFDGEKVERGKDIPITLRTDGIATEYVVNTDILFSLGFNDNGTLDGIEKEIKNLSQQLKQLTDKIRK